MSVADPSRPTARLGRRLAAMFYDSLLLIAIYFVVTAVLLYFTGGEAIPPGHLGFSGLLLAIAWAFHLVFWRRGGRTLGMQSWRLRLITSDGSTPPTGALIKRLAIATAPLAPMLFGLFWLPLMLFAAAYGWALIDRDGMTWHDRLTSTRPVLEPRK